MAKVSICIPAYNNSAGIRRLLASVELQTFKDYEVILTDDSETDEIEAVAEEKGYVHYYRNPVRLGPTANWNEAIGKSGGEYVKLMHHDDWFTDENSLREFADLLDRRPEADLAFSGTVQAEGTRSFSRHIREEDAELIRQDYRNLFLGNTIGSPSAVIVRRRKDEKNGSEPLYEESLKWLVDMEYYMRILREHPAFAYTKRPLVTIGVGEDQLTEQCRDDRELNAREYAFIYDRYRLETGKEYRRKLCTILAEARKSAGEAAEHGIGRWEYGKERLSKLMGAVGYKISHL